MKAVAQLVVRRWSVSPARLAELQHFRYSRMQYASARIAVHISLEITIGSDARQAITDQLTNDQLTDLMFGRDDKVSAIRLTAAQYVILAIFLVLAYGLWRLQVMQSGLLRLGGGEKPHPQCADSRAPRQDSGSRRARHRRQLSVVLGAAAARFLPRPECRRRPDCAGPASGSERSAHADSPLRVHAAVSADLSEGRHHSGRAGVHRCASQRVAGTGHDRGAPAACIRATDSWRT